MGKRDRDDRPRPIHVRTTDDGDTAWSRHNYRTTITWSDGKETKGTSTRSPQYAYDEAYKKR